MQNYFMYTPIYKIWISVIDYLTPKSGFIIEKLNYQFKDLICNREGLVITYINNSINLELVYAHEYRSYFCRLIDIQTNSKKEWRNLPPVINNNLETFSDLETEIDKWMSFLKAEL